MQEVHREVYHSPVSAAGEASVRVAAHAERERSVMVVVEGTQRFVPHDLESESLCDPLKVAELLKFVLFHSYFLVLNPFIYFFVLEYNPVCAEYSMKPRSFHTLN